MSGRMNDNPTRRTMQEELYQSASADRLLDAVVIGGGQTGLRAGAPAEAGIAGQRAS